jgi:protein KTI12
MPLATLCGFPSSGKSRRAEEIRGYFEDAGIEVHVVSDESVGLEPAKVYMSSREEKMARGQLKAAVERVLTKDNLVVLDSLNYIKGFRYELFCAAKVFGEVWGASVASGVCIRGTRLDSPNLPQAMGTRSCVIYPATSETQALEWNKQTDHYTDELFRELVMRFEFPEPKNRWDKPLFVVEPDESV